MTALQSILYQLANTVVVWRDWAIAILAVVVMVCLWLYATILEGS